MKTDQQIVRGCEHDGSYVPISEVYRLMKEARAEERKVVLTMIRYMNAERRRDEKEGIKHSTAQEYNAVISSIKAIE